MTLWQKFRSLPAWAQLAGGYAAYKLSSEIYTIATSKKLTGNVVLITGAASGIGRLMALYLSRDHACQVVLWDLNAEALESVKNEIEAFGGKALTYVVDVTNRSLVYETASKVLTVTGKVDILINNAGIVSGNKILECDDDRMVKTMEVNTISHFWTIKAFLPKMISEKSGHIVTIASMAGHVGTAGLVDYGASKFGAVGLTESLKLELRHMGLASNVHTTCVCPFFIKTGMFEGASSKYETLFPILEPEYVARKVINAIVRKDTMLLMPRMMYTTPLLKTVLPEAALNAVSDFFDINGAMDNFVQTRKH